MTAPGHSCAIETAWRDSSKMPEAEAFDDLNAAEHRPPTSMHPTMAPKTEAASATPESQSDFAAEITEQWSRERPDLDFSSSGTLGRIWRIWEMTQAERESRSREYGFSAGDMTVLVTLRRSGAPYALRPEDLRQACVVTSGAITGRIQRLATLGLVTRKESAQDRRSAIVRLTRKGVKVADALVERSVTESSFAQAYEALPPADRLALDDLLRRIQQAMEAPAQPDASSP